MDIETDMEAGMTNPLVNMHFPTGQPQSELVTTCVFLSSHRISGTNVRPNFVLRQTLKNVCAFKVDLVVLPWEAPAGLADVNPYYTIRSNTLASLSSNQCYFPEMGLALPMVRQNVLCVVPVHNNVSAAILTPNMTSSGDWRSVQGGVDINHVDFTLTAADGTEVTGLALIWAIVILFKHSNSTEHNYNIAIKL